MLFFAVKVLDQADTRSMRRSNSENPRRRRDYSDIIFDSFLGACERALSLVLPHTNGFDRRILPRHLHSQPFPMLLPLISMLQRPRLASRITPNEPQTKSLLSLSRQSFLSLVSWRLVSLACTASSRHQRRHHWYPSPLIYCRRNDDATDLPRQISQ